VAPGSYVVIRRPGQDQPAVLTVKEITTPSRSAYGLNAPTTKITLSGKWWDPSASEPQSTFADVRGASVFTQSEELPLAEEPIADPICGSDDASDPDAYIELDGVYAELQAGRWLIVAGERTDIQTPDPDHPDQTVPVTGIQSSELVMLSEVVQRVAEAGWAVQTSGYYGHGPQPLPGERIHTYIRLARKLEYCYRRDTVKIYGNVVKATHGETRNEVLGSGDGSKAFQSFALKQPPLTYIPATTPAGVESTLKAYVNDVEWHETDALAGLGPTERRFITRTDDDGKTTVIFGNGRAGARVPTGLENIRAVYRNGIGKAGNVQAEQISLLATRPLGVKSVINPMRAAGGADKETRDQARRNAPLTMLALERLVSVQDYADFARVFAGIGKSAATRLSIGRRDLVHVTIAGADDIPVDASSDLYRNLVKALRQFGDPDQPVQVDLRELKLLVISANIRILPDYLWVPVVTSVRARLLDTFSFDRRELGQDVLLSEVICAIQGITGVAYVDVDLLAGIDEKAVDPGAKKPRLRTPTEISAQVQAAVTASKARPVSRLPVNLADVVAGMVRPAQLAFLSPTVRDTLILNQIG
jgi:predicted phage baseplate assembly protein